MEKSISNKFNPINSKRSNNQAPDSQNATNIPPEYFNASQPLSVVPPAAVNHSGYGENDPQEAFQTGTNSNNPTPANRQSSQRYPAYGENDPQEAFQTGTNSNNPTPANRQSSQRYPTDGENRSQEAFQTGTNSNNPTEANPYSLQRYTGYTGNRPQYAFRTSSNSNANQAPQPRQRELTETLTFKGSNGQSYDVLPHLNSAQAHEVEIQSGILLRKDPANPDRYSGELGRGNFGRVYVAKLSNRNKYIAVKIIQGDDSALIESSHESTLQRKLTQVTSEKNSQLMPMDDAVEVKENGKVVALYTVMPLAALGTAKELHQELNNLDSVSGNLRKLLVSHIAKSLLIGLYQMHKAHIYHLDLHSANVMINGEGKVQISDFGTSEELIIMPPSIIPGRNAQGRTIGMGAVNYFPPERPRTLKNLREFDPAKSDLYQVGALLWEFITGEQFQGNHNNQTLNHPLLKNPPANSIADLAKQLLSDSPDNRPSIETALNHPSLCQAELHDQKLMSTVLDFLKRFVHYSQLKAQGVMSEKQAEQELQAQLNQSQRGDALSNDPLQLNPLLMTPFDNRADIKEQLAMYLPLSASLGRKVDNQQQDTFDLYEHTQKFLSDQNKTILLLLADGGSGKSLFMQYLTTSLLQNKVSAPNGKAYLPLYITLSSIRNPDRLLEEGLNLTHQAIRELQKSYQILILADGFDEQVTWTNLYIQNQLHRYDTTDNNIKHSIKLIISCRVNALPPNYGEYFSPRVAGEAYARPMQEVYVQPFQTNQIDTYVTNYIKQHQISIEEQIKHNQLPEQWLNQKYVQEQINSIAGLKELMQTPLLSRLVLIALPELLKQQSSSASSRMQGSTKTSGNITKAQVYEAFMRQWIITQIQKSPSRAKVELATTANNEQIEAIITAVLDFGEKIALTIYQNKGAELNVGLITFSFNLELGHYKQTPSRYPWFEQGRSKLWLLPLQEAQSGIYKLIHLSITEYLLASSLVRELNQNPTLKSLKLNQLALTIDEKNRPILYFLGDMASSSKVTENNLFALINQTKLDKTQSRAGANAISILNAAHVVLTHRDFSNTSLPHADLSGAVLFHTNFSKADLSQSNLKGTKLNNSNFSQANLSEICLGQYPMYRLQKEIEAISYSPDGGYLAISQGREMILFNASTRKEVRRFKGHTSDITSISFSKDGRRVATGCDYDRVCRLWDVASGRKLWVLSGHTSYINSVSFSPDGRRVATGSWDKTCRLWDVGSGKELRVLSGHTGEINSVSFSPDGSIVATGSGDATCRLWDVSSFKELGVLRGHTGKINSVSFSPDGTKVATGSGNYMDTDNTCRLWNVASCRELAVLSGHTQEIKSVSFSPDGRIVATGSTDNTCRLWDVVSGKELGVLRGHESSIKSVSFSPDGIKVATGSDDNTCRLWDVESDKELGLLRGHTSYIDSVSFSPDGRIVATGSYDNTCRLWDAESGRKLWVLRGHTRGIKSVSFSPNGRLVATGGNFLDKTCRLWDVASGKELGMLRGHTDSINSVSFSSDGRIVATGSDDATCRLWDVASCRELAVLSGHTSWINSVSFSPDGRIVATGSRDSTCRLWDVASGRELGVLSGHTDDIASVSFSPDGSIVATGSWDNTCRLWDVASGRELGVLRGHTSFIMSVSFSPDGSKLITKDYDGTKKVWLVSTKVELKGDQATLEPLRSHHTLDDITANYKDKRVTLSQKVITSTNTSTSIKSFSIDFPDWIRDISLSKDNVENKIVFMVVMVKGVAFYAKELSAPLNGFVAISISMVDQALDAHNMYVSGSIGLSQSNYEVLKQLGSSGKPAKILKENLQLPQGINQIELPQPKSLDSVTIRTRSSLVRAEDESIDLLDTTESEAQAKQVIQDENLLDSEKFAHLPQVESRRTNRAPENWISKFFSGIFNKVNISKDE